MGGFFVVALAQFQDGRVGVVSFSSLPEASIGAPGPDGLSAVGQATDSRPTAEAVAEALRLFAESLSK